MLGPVHKETRHLHHACEKHPVGAAMASGNPPPMWYDAWMAALFEIHNVIDQQAPLFMDRTEALRKDLEQRGMYHIPKVAIDYARHLQSAPLVEIRGAQYVLYGAHLFGGEIMRRRMRDLPTAHLVWEDRPAALRWFKILRDMEEITPHAVTCFEQLLAIMDEIQESLG